MKLVLKVHIYLIKSGRLILPIMLLFLTVSYGQNTSKTVYPAIPVQEIKTLESVQDFGQPEWAIEEGELPLTINDILKGTIKDAQIVKINPEIAGIKFGNSYWFAKTFQSEVELKNWYMHLQHDGGRFGFLYNYSDIDSYFVKDNKVITKGKTGYEVPEVERDFKGRHTHSLLKFDAHKGDKITLWIHLKKELSATNTFFPPFVLYDISKTAPAYPYMTKNLLTLGAIIIIFLIALFLFIIEWDKVSKWLLIFISIFIVDHLTIFAMDPLAAFLFPSYPILGRFFGYYTSILMVSSLLYFARVFIDLPKNYPRIDKFYLFGNLFLLLLGLLTGIFNYYFIIDIVLYFSIAYLVIYLGSGILFLFLNSIYARLTGIGMLFFIIGLFVGNGSHIGVFMANFGLFTPLIVGVAYRFKKVIDERLNAEKSKKELVLNQNIQLEQQVKVRTTELRESLESLKSTQALLIQSEKMASLGELTAGIAHEIQNPLNFVNNYSEVNVELIEEIKEEVGKGNYSEISVLLDDLEDNESKIVLHGKRADAIVRGMLQHSRTHSGTKEPTDLNQLADEYLRLAYHGLSAKDSSFEADFTTDFDENLPKIEVVPQDMGRVLLNIINNAFQAVDEKRRVGLEGYQPTVKVSTRMLEDSVEIRISDNGNGIPEDIHDKIFQPFFTTKPTGQGTGLGLSLAYDIVKAQGGEITVESKTGKGTEFKIRLNV